MNINLSGNQSEIERQKKYNKKHRLIVAWKRKINVFLGLCRLCGKETRGYLCCSCRDKKNGKKICKVPFCQNVPPKFKQFCDEHKSYRSLYHNASCSVSFNHCDYCGELFTAKREHGKICKSCKNKHLQSKKWKSENKSKVKKFQKKHYDKIKDNAEFKTKLKEYRIKNKPKSDKYFKEYNKTEKRADAIKESARKRFLIPGVRENAIKSNMYRRLFLCDTYVIEKISRRLKVKKDNITPDMIVIDRELMEHQRLTKELNNVINRNRDQRTEGITCTG